MPTPLCFLDTETDGVHPGRKVWEVAAIRRDDDGERAYHAFIEINLATADPFGLKIGGFYERHSLGRYLSGVSSELPIREPGPVRRSIAQRSGEAEMVTTGEAAYAIARLTHGAHIVGAVPNFDTEVLAGLLRQHGLTPAWHYHLIDVESLAVGYLWHEAAEGFAAGHPDVDPPVPPWDSEALSRLCGIDPPGEDERHTALGDARWAMRLYDAITGGA